LTEEEHEEAARPAARPVQEPDRIVGLDVLRGVAVLGILIMNIQAFAMPMAAYTNPTAFGDLTGVNLVVWTVSRVLADHKFMTIFSMLFGAGVCLFVERAVASTGRAAGFHYRRMLLLLVVGIAHAFLLFYGDVLVTYALCGLWVFLFRNRSPRTLLIVGGLLLVVPFALFMLLGFSIPHMPAEAVAAMQRSWAPSEADIAAYTAGMNGSFQEQIATRALWTTGMLTQAFLFYYVWRAGGMMLVGMALYKMGVLTGARSTAAYRWTAIVGIPFALVVGVWGIVRNFEHEWAFEYSMPYGGMWNYFGSIAMALAYVSLVLLAVKGGFWTALQARLAAVGRMAFTNYLVQSLLCTLVINGLGLFGSLERWHQILFVIPILALQLWYSPLWLARYRYGPMEWLWRAGTYGRLAPLRR
jgi:uncharacterized protein